MGDNPDAGLWDVEIKESARKQLRTLPGPEREEALDLLTDLEEDPFLSGVERLRNYNNRFKIRFGRGERYRLLYDIYPASRRVIVGVIQLRSPDTYRGMDRW